jgi:hypothetical protein
VQAARDEPGGARVAELREAKEKTQADVTNRCASSFYCGGQNNEQINNQKENKEEEEIALEFEKVKTDKKTKAKRTRAVGEERVLEVREE